jgi:hypothetical protein
MSTIGYSSWAVDLAEVGAIYPFQGSEVVMTIVAVVLWLAWHVVEIRGENAQLERLSDKSRVTDDDRRRSIERY